MVKVCAVTCVFGLFSHQVVSREVLHHSCCCTLYINAGYTVVCVSCLYTRWFVVNMDGELASLPCVCGVSLQKSRKWLSVNVSLL